MGLVPTFCLLIALNGGTWYCSGRGCPQSVVFFKVSWESKVMPRNFT